ncbi:MAG: C2H2-type zinc finger protein [Candidatus Heimdallarchaeaceae archaeon]
MSSEHEIALIVVGYKTSPFLETILQEETIPFSIITNNSCDFQIHHADPSKVLNYSLEFSKVIEILAKKSMDSLAVFETLGQFFEFYNPLHLSTLNYLISKYATKIKPENKNYLNAWKEIASSIFDEEFIYPLFEETRILHIKEGDIEIPVRQFVISTEIELQKNNSKNNNKSLEQIGENITGIIDLEEAQKMKLCSESVKKIVAASAVIIVPTDIISLFILFSIESFRDILKRTSGKIAFISPFWEGDKATPLERIILEKTGFEANLLNVVNFVKDTVDTIIIDDSDSSLVPQLREAGVTVLVENLEEDCQKAHKFLDTILRSIDLNLEDILIEPKQRIEGLGDKLVNLFKVKESKKEEIDAFSEILDLEVKPIEEKEELVQESSSEEIEKQKEKELFSLEEEASEIDETSLTDEFEMEVIDTEKDITAIPSPPPKEVPLEGEVIKTKTNGQFILPGIEQLTQFELEDIESLDVDEHIISSFIDRAMMSNSAGIEVVFSDLLSLQNNPLLIDKIFQTILKKLIKHRKASPEEKIADMITYLSAHKPDYYSDKLLEIIEQTLSSKDEREFYSNLQNCSIITRSSIIIAEDVLKKVLSTHLPCKDNLKLEKFRRMIRAFASVDYSLMELVADSLIKFYASTLEKEEKNEDTIEQIISLLSILDSYSAAIALVSCDSSEVRDDMYERVQKLTFNESFKEIVLQTLEAFKEGSYEKLEENLVGFEIPNQIEFEMLKKKYISSLSKVGSIPLEIFAEQIGLSREKTEKLIYDMILKEEIPARIELVEGRLYIVKEEEKAEEKPVEEGKIVEGEKIAAEEEKPVVEEKIVEGEKIVVEEEKPAVEEEKVEEKPVEKKLEEEKFICPECKKEFSSLKGLRVHKARMHK